MNYEVRGFAPFSKEEMDEMFSVLDKHYQPRLETIIFYYNGITVISSDQGGHPFKPLMITFASDPETVRKSCLAFVRAL